MLSAVVKFNHAQWQRRKCHQLAR